MFAREKFAEHFAAVIYGASENHAVGPREIYVFKNAKLRISGGGEANGFESSARDAQHFAGFDIANVSCADEIEGASFGCNDPAIAQAAKS